MVAVPRVPGCAEPGRGRPSGCCGGYGTVPALPAPAGRAEQSSSPSIRRGHLHPPGSVVRPAAEPARSPPAPGELVRSPAWGARGARLGGQVPAGRAAVEAASSPQSPDNPPSARSIRDNPRPGLPPPVTAFDLILL